MKKLSRDRKKSDMVEGLYVMNGKLINDRPNAMTGLEMAAVTKKRMKQDQAVQMISDGIERAKMRDEIRDLFG